MRKYIVYQLLFVAIIFLSSCHLKKAKQKLKTSKGGLLSFNNFLSTSFNYDVSHMFAESSSYNPDLIGILFRMNIDPSKSSTPFAFIKNISHHYDEEEISRLVGAGALEEICTNG